MVRRIPGHAMSRIRPTLDLRQGSSTTNPGHAVANPRIRDDQPSSHSPASCHGRSHKIPNIGKTGERVAASGNLENGHESVRFEQIVW